MSCPKGKRNHSNKSIILGLPRDPIDMFDELGWENARNSQRTFGTQQRSQLSTIPRIDFCKEPLLLKGKMRTSCKSRAETPWEIRSVTSGQVIAIKSPSFAQQTAEIRSYGERSGLVCLTPEGRTSGSIERTGLVCLTLEGRTLWQCRETGSVWLAEQGRKALPGDSGGRSSTVC